MIQNLRLSILLVPVFFFVISQRAAAREWTDVDGKKLEADYVSCAQNAVTLRLQNDDEVVVPIRLLSIRDRYFLARLAPSVGDALKEIKRLEGQIRKAKRQIKKPKRKRNTIKRLRRKIGRVNYC